MRFLFEKMLYHAKLRLTGRDDPIIVYTMGKVGSSTISRSLVDIYGMNGVHQVHWLTPAALARDERHYRNQALRYADTEFARDFFPRYVWRGQYLSQMLSRNRNRNLPLRVITLVRDPVARNISAFFQNLRTFFDYDYKAELRARGADSVKNELIQLFLDHYVAGSDVLEVDCDPISWLDDELNRNLGVDVFAQPFPIERGFEIYETSDVRVLLIRLEDMRRSAVPALMDFLELDEFELKDANVGMAKPYASHYREVVAGLQLPADYLDHHYDSRMARHFYSDDDLETFRRRWGPD